MRDNTGIRSAQQPAFGLLQICATGVKQHTIEKPVKERFWGDESGQTFVLAAVCKTVLVGMLGLTIAAGKLRYQKGRMNTLADASALAGVLDPCVCAGTSSCTSMQTVATVAPKENSLPCSLVTYCATRTGKLRSP